MERAWRKTTIRLPGQYYDQETGLHYNYYRTYDPSTGRYLEADPIGIIPPPGVTPYEINHLYAYVGNNPLNGIDQRWPQKPEQPTKWISSLN